MGETRNFFDNRLLFSDRCLQERLVDTSNWSVDPYWTFSHYQKYYVVHGSDWIKEDGQTCTTHEKLMETDVPVFDEKVNIKPLIELREELAEVENKIEKTDRLIDQVVYRLYGLTEEEIEIVESNLE